MLWPRATRSDRYPSMLHPPIMRRPRARYWGFGELKNSEPALSFVEEYKTRAGLPTFGAASLVLRIPWQGDPIATAERLWRGRTAISQAIPDAYSPRHIAAFFCANTYSKSAWEEALELTRRPTQKL